jgi:hypothetical protein
MSDVRNMRPAFRDFPVISADSHINPPYEIFDKLPADLRACAPRFEKRDGIMWYLSDGLPDYPSLPENLDGIWDDATTRMMREREYRLTWGQASESQQSQQTRIRDQLRDGVEAEVLYQNSGGDLPASPRLDYQIAASRLLNEWVADWAKWYEHRYVATATVSLYLDRTAPQSDQLQ